MFLRTVGIFSGLTDQQLDTLLRGSRHRSYAKGSVIVTEGDSAHALFVVKTGALKAYLTGDDGKEVILSTLGPNDYFGELALIDDEPRSAMVAASERSELLQVPKEAFQQLLLNDPQAMLAVTRSLASKIRQLTDNVRTLALVDVFGRITHLLNALGVANADDHLVISPKPTQQEIASRVGSSREMVSRIFKDLVIGKYIVIDQDCIKVCKPLPMKW
jgi:CRP/FNR family transcriptional regulator, cyclic AMP receptor protein